MGSSRMAADPSYKIRYMTIHKNSGGEQWTYAPGFTVEKGEKVVHLGQDMSTWFKSLAEAEVVASKMADEAIAQLKKDARE